LNLYKINNPKLGEDDVKNLLNEVGINVDNAAVKRVVEALKGKNLDDVVKEGLKKV
jgi:ribosomal protein L12E/L44/L45/RPP1/RPP2